MINLRNKGVKETGVELQHETQEIPITETSSWTSASPHLRTQMMTAAAANLEGKGLFPSDITFEDLIPKVGAILPRFPDVGDRPQDVIPMCGRYLSLLEQFVQDCEQRNPEDPAASR